MSAIDDRPFPRAALFGAAVLIGLTLATVGAARVQTWVDPAPPSTLADAHGASVVERVLAFGEHPDGGVLAEDVASGAQLRVASGKDGFVRGVLRSFARERRAYGLGAEAGAFRLSRHADGTLWLVDEATGRQVELSAFGRDNRAAFEVLLSGEGG